MNYWNFVFGNWRFLAFGFLLTWFASFGRTFFISLFSADIRAAFGLSHGDFGAVYSAATVACAPCLIWLGSKIDDVDLRRYAMLACAAFAAACLLLASAPSAVLLGLAIFAVRVTAPVLMGHTATISMARYFERGRGKAVGFASLGQSAGEAVLPLMAVALTAAIGWRGTWIVVGAATAVLLVPAVLWLLEGHGERHRRLVERIAATEVNPGTSRRQWSRREVVRDARFYLMMPTVMAPFFIFSGLIFHQVHLADSKGWSLTWLATCFIGFAAAKVAAVLISGPLIDRFGAARLMPYYMVPLGMGLVALAGFDHPVVALIYLTAAGLSVGMRIAVVGALWAEMYGVAHLGAIRGLTTSLSVTSSALSPALFGWLLDLGITMETIALMCLALGAAATVLLMAPALRANL